MFTNWEQAELCIEGCLAGTVSLGMWDGLTGKGWWGEQRPSLTPLLDFNLQELSIGQRGSLNKGSQLLQLVIQPRGASCPVCPGSLLVMALNFLLGTAFPLSCAMI